MGWLVKACPCFVVGVDGSLLLFWIVDFEFDELVFMNSEICGGWGVGDDFLDLNNGVVSFYELGI